MVASERKSQDGYPVHSILENAETYCLHKTFHDFMLASSQPDWLRGKRIGLITGRRRRWQSFRDCISIRSPVVPVVVDARARV